VYQSKLFAALVIGHLTVEDTYCCFLSSASQPTGSRQTTTVFWQF